MERVDFGGHPKYNHSGAAAFSLSGRFDRNGGVAKATKQRGLGLFDLNPHKSSLGLNLQDFTAEKLCPRPTPADLHSDTVAPPVAAATGAAPDQKAEAGSDAAGGSKQPQQTSVQAAAENDVPQEQQQQVKQQQQSATQALGANSAAGAAADADRRKRQRTSEQPDDPAAAAGNGVQHTSKHAAAGDPGSSPGRGEDFIFIDSSSEDSGSESDDERSEPPSPGQRRQRNKQQGRQQGRQQNRQQDSDMIIIDSDDEGFYSPQKAAAAAAAGAAAAAADEGQISKRQRRKQKQQQQDEQQQGDNRGAEGAEFFSCDSGSDSDGNSEDSGGSSDMSMSEEKSEDEDFIPLLDLPTGPGNNGTSDAHTREQKQQQRELGYQPPWLPRLAHFSSPYLRLHNEIVAFCQMLAPTAEESASRSASLESLKGIVRGIWPSADVLVFGSYATGLYTPASDTDVVVVGTGGVDAQTGLRALAGALDAQHLVRNIQLVLSARVPIIKFEMIDSGLAFDVSWEVPSGPQGAEIVRQLLEEWPSLKPLALVLKVFLTQRELNEVYTGGVGSYTLIIMIVALLQLHQSRRLTGGGQQQQGSSSSRHKRRRGRGNQGGEDDAQPLDGNLGLLLVDFLRLYGRVLNLNHVGIACKGHGCYFDRTNRAGFQHSAVRRGGGTIPNHVTLSVEDPIDPTNDTARGSYNMKTVRQVFDHAYQLLTSPCPSNMSPLGRIIHLAPVVSGRPVPPWCVEAVEGRSQGSGRSHRRSDSSNGGRKQRHNSSRDSGRDGDRGRGRRDSRGDSQRSTHNSSRSRSKDRNRGGKTHHHHQQQQQQRFSSSKPHRRDSSTDGGKQHKGKNSNQQGAGGNKQQQQQQQQQGGRQQGGSDRIRGGMQGSKGGNGSRQSFGSDGGGGYGHRDKRRRY